MSWLKTLLSVPDGHRSSSSVVSWWETRRFIFNAVVLPVGFVNLIAFAYINDVLLKPYLSFFERDWELISVPLAAVALNIAYTSGWITELMLRAVLGRDLRRLGPTLFCIGLGLSLLFTFAPPVGGGLRWVSFVTGVAHSSISTSGAHLSNFTGAPWNATITTTEACSDTQKFPDWLPDGGDTPPTRGSYLFALSPSGSSGITFATTDGCVLDFTVSGDSAKLSNGPVTCNESTDAGAIVVTYSSYWLSAPDGFPILSGSVVRSRTLKGVFSCRFHDTIFATR